MDNGWLAPEPNDPFGLQTLPYGVVAPPGTERDEPAVRVGAHALPLAPACSLLRPELTPLFSGGNLDRFLAAGRDTWAEVRALATEWLTDPAHEPLLRPLLIPLSGSSAAQTRLPFTVADYVDFYASEHHATNLGTLFRPGSPPLTPNWKHLPIGYHGRAGTVIVSGSDVVRPTGQRRDGDAIAFGPTLKLDIEAELGFVVGVGSALGTSVPVSAFEDHVFGVVVLNDWSARDIQAWEYVPLGPFLGKSFATSVSAWITPLAALANARFQPAPRDPKVLDYLDDSGQPWGLDITLEVTLNGRTISNPPYGSMYWTPAQMLAHMTVNGASLRTGDLFGSGTISGDTADQWGSLIELSQNGHTPIALEGMGERTFLEDGDTVVITATAPGPDGTRVGIAEVTGRIRPAVS